MTPIDLVFTYVDGADPAHRGRRQAYAAPGTVEPASWYAGVGEIAYAVRSALQFLPWLRQVVIVSDGQRPPVNDALFAAGRVRLVDHADFIPAPYRPAFDSSVIESLLHRIPGLSDIYLYNNDDFFFGGPLRRDDFVVGGPAGDDRLLLRTVPAVLREALRRASDRLPVLPRANIYTCGISNAARQLRAAGFPWRDIVVPRHVTQVYRIATARRLDALLAEALHASRALHVKSRRQLSWSTLAYSLEKRDFGGRASTIADIAGRGRDELFLDIGRGFPAGHAARCWRKLARSRARFICLNNIPEGEAVAFERAMLRRGLAPPQES